jgi:uncharacterized Zn-finger protein
MNSEEGHMFLEMPVPEAGHLPKFRNDFAAAEIRIGVNEFNCIGVSPPDDHPHVYVAMGSNDTALCPYRPFIAMTRALDHRRPSRGIVST